MTIILLGCVSGSRILAQGPPPGWPFISEIMYNSPESGQDSLEFIEITPDYISGSVAPGDYFSSGIDFTFPAGGNYYQIVVIAKDSVAFENAFGIPAFQWNNSALLNSGEAIVLRHADGGIIDSVFYQPSSPWPTEANGNGHSIEMCSIDFAADSNDPNNWAASQSNTAVVVNGMTIYASPGVHTGNCITVGVEEARGSEEFQAYPNPTEGGFALSLPEFDDDAVFSIRDMKGSLVHFETVPKGVSKLEKQLNLARGVYVLKLVIGEQHYTQHLMVTE
ncbi:MAG: T9SS type A sorting domain-containing protein [Flavobacteriales bacterium]|nr:T9SS type A sorting domain-containing protein [Flavobacteriales bacterium]